MDLVVSWRAEDDDRMKIFANHDRWFLMIEYSVPVDDPDARRAVRISDDHLADIQITVSRFGFCLRKQEKPNDAGDVQGLNKSHYVPPHQHVVGSPAILGSFGESNMASRRKRGPVALRPRLWSGLPLSNVTKFYAPIGESRQFGDVLNVGFGLRFQPVNATTSL